MNELMFQTWPDADHRWHWVVFKNDRQWLKESPRTFDSREEAEWDAKRFIQVLH